jgi:hypothetical protein
VVDEAVDHGGGDHVVAEDLAPAIWGWHLFARLGFRCHLAVSAVCWSRSFSW